MIRPRIDLAQLVVAEVPLFHRARPEILQQEIRLADQFAGDRLALAFRRFSVTDFLLRATTGHHRDMPCAFSWPQSRMGSPWFGRLDLDDLGPEVAQQLAAEWTGQQSAHLDHPQSGQRTGRLLCRRRHVVSSSVGQSLPGSPAAA